MVNGARVPVEPNMENAMPFTEVLEHDAVQRQKASEFLIAHVLVYQLHPHRSSQYVPTQLGGPNGPTLGLNLDRLNHLRSPSPFRRKLNIDETVRPHL